MILPPGEWDGDAREVAPGVVAILEPEAARVRVIDIAAKKISEITWPKAGRPPFNIVVGLIPYAGDTLATFAQIQGRYFLFTKNGPAGSVALPPASRPRAGPRRISDFLPPPAPTAADERGNVYGLSLPLPDLTDPKLAPPQSLALLRMDRAMTRFDTVGKVRQASMDREMTDSAGQSQIVMTPHLESGDAWAALADGHVAIVRASDFRIDWTSPSGAHTSSPPLPHTVRAYSDSEWAATVAPYSHIGDLNGAADSMTRKLGLPPQPGVATARMVVGLPPRPAHKSFFDSVIAATDTTLWINLSSDDEASTYLVVDVSGAVRSRVVLPHGGDIVAFGPHRLYVKRYSAAGDVLAQYVY